MVILTLINFLQKSCNPQISMRISKIIYRFIVVSGHINIFLHFLMNIVFFVVESEFITSPWALVFEL